MTLSWKENCSLLTLCPFPLLHQKVQVWIFLPLLLFPPLHIPIHFSHCLLESLQQGGFYPLFWWQIWPPPLFWVFLIVVKSTPFYRLNFWIYGMFKCSHIVGHRSLPTTSLLARVEHCTPWTVLPSPCPPSGIHHFVFPMSLITLDTSFKRSHVIFVFL